MRRRQRFADLPVRIEQREISVDGRGQTYGLLIPKAAADASGYPMILGLHYASPTPGLSPYFGLGYVGQLVLPALQELNAILVAPDAPDATWTSAISERLVQAVIAELKKESAIDPRRTLVTGFSMGGTGTWSMAAKHPELFRGAIPVAAAPPPADLEPAMPVYVIHSRKDESNAFEPTEKAVRALEDAGRQHHVGGARRGAASGCDGVYRTAQRGNPVDSARVGGVRAGRGAACGAGTGVRSRKTSFALCGSRSTQQLRTAHLPQCAPRVRPARRPPAKRIVATGCAVLARTTKTRFS